MIIRNWPNEPGGLTSNSVQRWEISQQKWETPMKTERSSIKLLMVVNMRHFRTPNISPRQNVDSATNAGATTKKWHDQVTNKTQERQSVDSWLVEFFSWTLHVYSSFQCFNNEWTIHSWKSALVCFNALGQTSTLDQVLANENLQGCKVDISIYGYHLMCIPRTVAKKPVRSLYDSTVWRRHRSWEDQLEKPRTHCISLLSATFGFPWEFRISGMCPATLRFFLNMG